MDLDSDDGAGLGATHSGERDWTGPDIAELGGGQQELAPGYVGAHDRRFQLRRTAGPAEPDGSGANGAPEKPINGTLPPMCDVCYWYFQTDQPVNTFIIEGFTFQISEAVRAG